MILFIFGSISLGALLVMGSAFFAFDAYQLYVEHGIFGYGILAIVIPGIIVGVSIPFFVVPLARIALRSIENEREILESEGIERLKDLRRANEAIYPKKFGLNKN